jgi:lactate racemase
MEIKLPYGKQKLSVNISDENLLKKVMPKEMPPYDKPEIIIRNALENPMGTDKLYEIAASGDKVAIVVDDYTRPCPNEKLLLPVLEDLKKAGVPFSDIKIIVACGTHTPPDYEKIKEIVGDKVARNYMVISSDVENGDYVSVGVSKQGNDIRVLREYVEADVKILLGDVEYHYFAGYGGTRKSVLPGISAKECIQKNHSQLFDSKSNTGVLHGNPVNEEMTEALHMAGCDFCLNVVMNSSHQIVGAWSGRANNVMNSAVKLVDEMYMVEIDEQPDITLIAANGHPHDINLYQALKAMHTAAQITKKNGVIILVAECPEGYGSDLYFDWLKKYKTSSEIEKRLKEDFVLGGHKAFYHRKTIEDFKVFFVTGMDKSCAEDTFELKCYSTVQEALDVAYNTLGPDSKVLVVPQGSTTHLVYSGK